MPLYLGLLLSVDLKFTFVCLFVLLRIPGWLQNYHSPAQNSPAVIPGISGMCLTWLKLPLKVLCFAHDIVTYSLCYKDAWEASPVFSVTCFGLQPRGMKNGCREILAISATWASVTTLLTVTPMSSGVAWMETAIMGTVGLPGDWLTGEQEVFFSLCLATAACCPCLVSQRVGLSLGSCPVY